MLRPILDQPAAMLKLQKTSTMVIADLHIGWEMTLSEKGIHVPTQMPKILKKLIELIREHKPERLLILGDVKYSVAIVEIGEWHDIPNFFSELKKEVSEISIIRGNHDGNLEALIPEGIEILPASGVVIDNVGFFHGHKWPSPALLSCKAVVMGHVHPIIAFRDQAGFRITRQVWVKARCNGPALAEILLKRRQATSEKASQKASRNLYGVKTETEELLIMPSFNDYLGGRPLNEGKLENPKSFAGPVIRSGAVDIADAETFLLDGTFLGRLNQLQVRG